MNSVRRAAKLVAVTATLLGAAVLDVGEDEIYANVRVSTSSSGFVLRTNELDHSF